MKLIGLFLFISIISCQPKGDVSVSQLQQKIFLPLAVKNDKARALIPSKKDMPYEDIINVIQSKKEKLNVAHNSGQISLDSISSYFTSAMMDQVFPYWMGTSWDFNGHTNIPGEDFVACGYFVSTPLKHLGLQLNRFKLAQQASKHIVESLAIDTKVFRWSNPDISKMVKEIKADFKPGLYVVGLSNHVGFLFLDHEDLYFIHSSFLYPQEVNVQVAAKDDAFIYSDIFYIAALSHNHSLMKKWVSGHSITIKTNG